MNSVKLISKLLEFTAIFTHLNQGKSPISGELQ